MVDPRSRSSFATRLVLVAFAAVAGALAAHAVQILLLGEVNLAVSGGAAALVAFLAWTYLHRRYRGFRKEG